MAFPYTGAGTITLSGAAGVVRSNQTRVKVLPIRAQILNAFIAALRNITEENGYNTNVVYVSDHMVLKSPEDLDKNKFPACFPIDANEDKEAATIGSNYQITSVLTIIVTSMVFDKGGTTFEKRCYLIDDVEKAIVNDTTLCGLLLMPPGITNVLSDVDWFGKYSVFHQSFDCAYMYTHLLTY